MTGSLLPTTNEVLRPTKYTSQLQLRGQDHDRLLLQVRSRQNNTQLGVQSASLVDRNASSPVASSPCLTHRAMGSLDQKIMPQGGSPIIEARPRRGVDRVTPPGDAVRTGPESATANLSQRPNNVQAKRVHLLSNREAPELHAVVRGHDHDQLPARWRTRPTTGTDQQSVHLQAPLQTLQRQSTKGSNASGSDGSGFRWRLPLVSSACAGLFNAAFAFSQFWQQSASATSWAGSALERFLVVSSKQFWHVRKGWCLN